MWQLDLLDRARQITGSDYKTAQAICVSKQRIAHIRSGRNRMPPYIAGKLAELIGDDPMIYASKAHADLALNKQEEKDWKKWAGAAVLTMIIGTFCANGYDSAAYAFFMPLFSISNIHYAYIWQRRLRNAEQAPGQPI